MATIPPKSASESGSQLSNLLELLPVAVYRCEAPSGRITFYNARAAELWGREPRADDTDERFCGSLRLWRRDGSALPHDQTPMALALTDGRATRNEEVVVERPDGSRITVLVNIDPLYGEGGKVVGAVNVFHDTTSLIGLEEARGSLSAIIESSHDAIISKNLSGIITSWNQGAEHLFGYTAAEAVGRSVTMLIPEDRHNEEPAILDRVRRGDRIDHYETVRRRKDGSHVDISLTVSPVRDGHGRVVGASKIARDISDRKDAEQQREMLLAAAEKARADAEAASRGKDEFLAMLGHELRNPLSAVRNAIAVAMLDAAKRDHALSVARRQADQLSRIVDDLLDVARITLGRVPLRKARVSLAEVVQRTIDGARGAMEERGHRLTLSLPADAVHVNADAARLEQALANLLTNAAKYTDPGGLVTVSAERHGDQAVVRVKDNGIGIPPEGLARIFDLFAQGDRSLDRHQGGLGIGLTLVRRIIEQHGGTVEAHSAGAGTGSEFVVRLPALADADEPYVSVLAERPQSNVDVAVRVLLVEDHPDAAESLQMMLEWAGHDVRLAADGLAALEAMRVSRPDIMLVDIGLPGMDGYELARHIRADDALKDVVLVALTGYGRPEDKVRASAAGFDDHFVKPVDPAALADYISRFRAGTAKR